MGRRSRRDEEELIEETETPEETEETVPVAEETEVQHSPFCTVNQGSNVCNCGAK